MKRSFEIHHSYATLIAGAALATFAAAAPVTAQTYTDLYDFCSQTSCTDGNYSAAPLVADAAGNLYGTTAEGGANGWGIIFELVHKKSGYSFRVLHNFCAETNCTDGYDPVAGLVIDTAGNLYGTTKFGGAQNGGSVFELLHGHKEKFKVLHSFCAQGAACADGAWPMYDGLTYQGAQSGTLYDGKSPLYGTTLYGSENNGGFAGVVYEMKPNRTGHKWREKVIWQFCSQTNCADGMQPRNGLVMDASGNLYGVTFGGGNNTGDGVAFKLSPSQGAWSETVLYDFCGATNCSDGTNPASALVPVGSGFVGAANGGGNANYGTLFSLVPNGTTWQLNVLHSFCSQTSCSDGEGPLGRIAVDASGDIFGVTVAGGDPNQSKGVVYEQTAQSVFSVLHTFCVGGNCTDGAAPVGGVILDSSGDIFGTVSEGGAHSDGDVFEITP